MKEKKLTRISDLKIGDNNVEDVHRLCSCMNRARRSLPEADTQQVRAKIDPFNPGLSDAGVKMSPVAFVRPAAR